MPTLAQGNGRDRRPLGAAQDDRRRCRRARRPDRPRPAPARPAGPVRRSAAAAISGAPPMPMLPSINSTLPQRPSPGSRSSTGRRSAGAPRSFVSGTACAEMSTPKRRDPLLGQRGHDPPRPAADVEHRPLAAAQRQPIDLVGRRPPAFHLGQRRHRPPIDAGGNYPHRRRAPSRTAVPDGAACCSRRCSRDIRSSGNAAAIAAASVGVSMSRSVGSSITL